jgi:transposase-like protein
MSNHRCGYRLWKQGRYSFYSVFNLFDSDGVDNCRIALLEECICETRDELRAREQYWFEKTPNCVNQLNPYMTKEQYRQNHNKQARKFHHKIRKYQKYDCKYCGSSMVKYSKSPHKKTDKHKYNKEYAKQVYNNMMAELESTERAADLEE